MKFDKNRCSMVFKFCKEWAWTHNAKSVISISTNNQLFGSLAIMEAIALAATNYNGDTLESNQ